MEKWVQMFEEGEIHPIDTVSEFEASDVESAFRTLQKGDSIGKVVVKMPEDPSLLPSLPQAQTLQFSAENLGYHELSGPEGDCKSK